MLLINNEAASQVLKIDECIEVVEAAFREEGLGRAVNRTKSQMHLPTSSHERWYRFSSVEGGLRHAGVVALRIKSDILCWPESFGQSRNFYYCMEPNRYCGLILLFKAENGEPLALMNDGVIQHMRVAATAAVAAKRMAREDASVVGLLGSGGMAESHLRAYAAVRPVKLAKVFSPHREHREQFAARMAEKLAIEVVPTDNPREAILNADIVATCTDTGEPILFAKWLGPGMHVTSVNHREIDTSVYERMDRYVKYQSGLAANYFTTPENWRPRSLGGGGQEQERLLRASAAVKQDLTELLVRQVPGRESKDEINFFKSEGTGVQFAAVSDLAYRKCLEQNLGQPLPLDWFIQKIRN